jgi:hypothetical protein
MTKEDIIRMALEALDSENPDIQVRAALALRTALEQPEQEPLTLPEPLSRLTTLRSNHE